MKAKTLFIAIFALFVTTSVSAQTDATTGASQQVSKTSEVQTFYSPSEHLILKFDIGSESVEVPTMEDFGLMHGYLKGHKEKKGEPYFYGVWTVTKIADEGTKKGIMMHISNDFGSETQEAHFRQTSDSTWVLHLEGQTVMKRVVGRKLVKVSDNLVFQKM